MRKFPLYCTTGLLVLFIAGLYSCKKVNEVNNGQVIETPYSLYYSDTSGALFNTTDGINILKLVFPPDGFPCRAICVAGNNILWAKTNLYISTNNGQNFNHAYDSLTSDPDLTCNNSMIDLNQTMIIDIPSWGRVYTMSNASPGDVNSFNYMGLVHNDKSGTRGNWYLDVYYDTDRVGIMPVSMMSLTQLANGILCGLAYDPSTGDAGTGYKRNFYKTCADDPTCRWKECTSNPDGIGTLPSFNSTGVPLPPYSASAYPSSYFTLGHFNNRLYAIDSKCNNGAWYSDDTGKNWTQCMGLPANVPLRCIASPYDQTCLIGTDSFGLYMLNLNTNTFELNNNGLGSHLKVRSIAFKENIYKNNTAQQYVYIATDQGIYQSTDAGHNWVKTIPGNFVAVY